ncbi:aldo/keto reductase [Rhodococcus opacus]|uniref:aldo/keto reductase n=1 Tax=Rhodococcus opacus TaxID=37919 RepID=UPI001C45C979|nr:aldo/keto reductase [Rhodococcus opacus]MBV6756718.1 aldo/keto reductase [Rhodococcus opacus]
MHMLPTLRMHNETEIPRLGFGTLNLTSTREDTKTNADAVAQTVGTAIEVGYRHIDTAQMYGNERGVGIALADSGLARDELFVTSKLGNGNHHPDDVRRSFDETLDKLGLDFLDLFLMHWPLPTLYDGDFVSTWSAMADLVTEGRLRSVGVSNFQSQHLERVIDATGVVPTVNQIEVHPYFHNNEVLTTCARHDIAVEAWSPLGKGAVLDDAVLTAIADAHEKSAAQVVLRWHLQHGRVAIPKSTRRARMSENSAVFDFELTSDDMQAIDALDRGNEGRRGPNPDTFDWIPGPGATRP